MFCLQQDSTNAKPHSDLPLIEMPNLRVCRIGATWSASLTYDFPILHTNVTRAPATTFAHSPHLRMLSLPSAAYFDTAVADCISHWPQLGKLRNFLLNIMITVLLRSDCEFCRPSVVAVVQLHIRYFVITRDQGGTAPGLNRSTHMLSED